MELGRPAKILVGALSLWPLVYMFVFIAFMFGMVFFIDQAASNGSHQQGPPAAFMLLFAVHMGTILMMFGLIAFYMVYLFKSDRVAQDKKALWAVVLFLGGMIAMPVFFYLYIWPDAPRQA
jgi:hypothetical protein